MSGCTIANSFFSKHSLFGGLSDEQIDAVRPYIKELDVTCGSAVLVQGEFNSTVFFIVKGKVTVEKHTPDHPDEERCIATLGAGESFGEMELIDVQPCAATVKATEKTHLVTLNNRDFYLLSKSHPPVYTMMMLNLARDISRHLRRTDELLADSAESLITFEDAFFE